MSAKTAQSWYRSFHGRDPARKKRVRVVMPKTIAVMGSLDFIGYTAVIDGHTTTPFKHTFARGAKALLCTDGKRLYIIGGRFHVTGRGIVDLSPKGRELE